MCTHTVHLRLRFLILSLSFGLIAAADTSAQDVLRVYGSEGPSPAINEAAVTFAGMNNVKVDVVSGPTHKWVDQAKTDADLIFSSAEFMMSDFVHAAEVAIDEASITPLYLRPSAIIVRPRNPKQIRDFPDLLRPGMKVMVVTGSGQTGLWEDMAGKLGNVQTLRLFRNNIAVFAANSEEAVKTWSDREDLDAWVTWNIWHMPLRDRAELVPVSKDYRIYRQCSIAMTQRCKNKPLARQFIEFLMSPEAVGIFDSWGWITPPADSSPVAVQRDICAVCRIKNDEWKGDVGKGLACVKELVDTYTSAGISYSELHFSAVFHGDAAYWLLKDEQYSAFTKKEGPNPNKSIIRDLVALGVSIELCGQTMKEHGWTRDNVLPEVKIVVSAYPRIIDLELQGYAYVRF